MKKLIFILIALLCSFAIPSISHEQVRTSFKENVQTTVYITKTSKLELACALMFAPAWGLNISTTVHGKKGLQEAYVGYVLDNEALRQYFNEDDRRFFKYIFASEGGINLRNNVAYCFYNYFDYNLDKMHVLLAALLKIAQYDLKEPE